MLMILLKLMVSPHAVQHYHSHACTSFTLYCNRNPDRTTHCTTQLLPRTNKPGIRPGARYLRTGTGDGEVARKGILNHALWFCCEHSGPGSWHRYTSAARVRPQDHFWCACRTSGQVKTVVRRLRGWRANTGGALPHGCTAGSAVRRAQLRLQILVCTSMYAHGTVKITTGDPRRISLTTPGQSRWRLTPTLDPQIVRAWVHLSPHCCPQAHAL